MRLRSLSIAPRACPEPPTSPFDAGGAGERQPWSARVRSQWRVDPSLLSGTFRGRAAPLPLDRWWDRKRLAELLGSTGSRCAKPTPKRRWGYYASRSLRRPPGRKLDATADRAEGELRVDAVHEDKPFRRARHPRRRAGGDPSTWPDETGLEPVLPAGGGPKPSGVIPWRRERFGCCFPALQVSCGSGGRACRDPGGVDAAATAPASCVAVWGCVPTGWLRERCARAGAGSRPAARGSRPGRHQNWSNRHHDLMTSRAQGLAARDHGSWWARGRRS